MKNMKELPADVFVENVVELLVSSGQSVTLHHAKKLLNRSISKLPQGRAKATAQAHLPQLKRLLKKKLQDVLPANETGPKRFKTSIGTTDGFRSAIRGGGSLSGLLQARLPAHPALLDRFLNEQEGFEFDQSILQILAASESPDAGHVINHACRRYSCELRRMSDMCITTQSDIDQKKAAVPDTIQRLSIIPLSNTDADPGRLKAICTALASIAALCPLRLAPAEAPYCILRNACPPPTSPIATLIFTNATAQVLAGWQQMQKTWLTAHHFQQAIVEVKRHLQQLVAGLPTDTAGTDLFLLQHPVTEVESCAPADPWAAVPSLAWVAMHAAVRSERHQACPALTTTAVLLQRQCSQRHACLGDSVASSKATAALAGMPCCAATCSWLTGLQQPTRFISALKRQDASHPNRLGAFLLTYPHTEDINHLQRLLLRSREQESELVEARDDDGLFVLDDHAYPIFTGAWGSPGSSEGEEQASSDEEGAATDESGEDGY